MAITRSVDVASVAVGARDGSPLFLLDVVDSWARHVVRFVRESSASGEALDRAWGADDWVAALYIRDELQRAVDGLPEEAELPAIAATDELFRAFTVFDDTEALRKTGHDLPREPWWWRRIPMAGPVTDDRSSW